MGRLQRTIRQHDRLLRVGDQLSPPSPAPENEEEAEEWWAQPWPERGAVAPVAEDFYLIGGNHAIPFRAAAGRMAGKKGAACAKTIQPPAPPPPAPEDEEEEEEWWAQPWPEENEIRRSFYDVLLLVLFFFVLFGPPFPDEPEFERSLQNWMEAHIQHLQNTIHAPPPPPPQEEEDGQGEELDENDWANPWPENWNPADFVVTNTPGPVATAFKREWFKGDGMVRRKNLPIEYKVCWKDASSPQHGHDRIPSHRTKIVILPPSCKLLYLYVNFCDYHFK
ncbi:hypothetical protein niasHT_036771 [Heterodera trifolii]|uniref:Uncharacterized protein n=1 Tax=Heterodera trifolii TaxID=157864 RepID=A0ABD2J6N8_9BILA